MLPMPVVRDWVVLAVLKLCRDPPEARFDDKGRDTGSGLGEELMDDERLRVSSAA